MAKPRIPRYIAPHWDADDARRFLAEAEKDPLAALYQVTLHTGLRFGEALGLQWDQIDIKGNAISVAQQVRETAGTYVIAQPKQSSIRKITVPRSVITARTYSLIGVLPYRPISGHPGSQEDRYGRQSRWEETVLHGVREEGSGHGN